jgi:hypothetical protein
MTCDGRLGEEQVTAQAGRVCRITALIGCAMVFAAGAAACNGGGDDLPPPPPPSPNAEAPSASPTPTFDARTTEAWQEIQTKFDGLMEAWIKWAAEGSPGGFENPAVSEVGEYADLFFLNDFMNELVDDTQAGHVRTGRPTWRDARLLSIDWEREVQDVVVPEAVFEICVDDSEWIKVDADTSEPAPGEPGGPHVWSVTAWWEEEREFGPEGWALIQREVDRSRSC